MALTDLFASDTLKEVLAGIDGLATSAEERGRIKLDWLGAGRRYINRIPELRLLLFPGPDFGRLFRFDSLGRQFRCFNNPQSNPRSSQTGKGLSVKLQSVRVGNFSFVRCYKNFAADTEPNHLCRTGLNRHLT